MTTARWNAVALGRVLSEARTRVVVDSRKSYPIAGVLGFGRGVLLRDAIRGSEMSATHLYRISAGQVIYSRLKAFEGAFAVVGPEADGRFVSNEFPTFDVDRSLAIPEYIGLLLGRPAVWEDLASNILGMGARRERLQIPDFLDFEVDLPDPETQRRLLAEVAAIDRSAREVDRERTRLLTVLRAFQNEIDLRGYAHAELDDVVESIDAGRSPKCLDRVPAESEWGVLKVSAVREGVFVASEAKALPPEIEPFTRAQVHAGDIIVSRANTAQLVGAACIVDREPQQLLLCDKTLRFHTDDTQIAPEYFVEALALPSVREQIVRAATGSSESMKNISQSSLLGLDVPLPSPSEQKELTRAFGAIRAAIRARTGELEALRGLRAAVIEDAVEPDTVPA